MKGVWISLLLLMLLAGCASNPATVVDDQGRIAREQAVERERIDRIQRETDAAVRRLNEQMK